jgi:hypothetical protein
MEPSARSGQRPGQDQAESQVNRYVPATEAELIAGRKVKIAIDDGVFLYLTYTIVYLGKDKGVAGVYVVETSGAGTRKEFAGYDEAVEKFNKIMEDHAVASALKALGIT